MSKYDIRTAVALLVGTVDLISYCSELIGAWHWQQLDHNMCTRAISLESTLTEEKMEHMGHLNDA